MNHATTDVTAVASMRNHEGHEASGHAGGHGKHAGHHVEMFRRRFWWSLLLTVPLVVTSHMVMDWFDYELDFYGIDSVGPVLGTLIFLWGGWPFLAGGAREAKDRMPGMMLLIAMAITVAYAASMATSLDWFDLDFWWELGALITIMLLGHWQEMKALGQAQDALAALAALLPDEAERVAADGSVETVPATTRPPTDLATGRDSPVTMDSSSSAAPSTISPSAGTRAPDRTNTTSPARSSSRRTVSTAPSPPIRSASSGSSAASAARASWA